MTKQKIAIIAGGGSLPLTLAQHLTMQGKESLIIGLIGHADKALLQTEYWVNLGAAGEVVSLLKTHQITELVIIGKVTRPSLQSLKPDKTARQILGNGLMNFFKGDNGLLSSIANYLEKECKVTLKGVHDYLPNLTSKAGNIVGRSPIAQEINDIHKGYDILKALSPFDLGQSIVLESGLVLGVEALEGTDALILRCAELKRHKNDLELKHGDEFLPAPILIKATKIKQDQRLDLPTIGLSTIQKAMDSGFAGIAIEAEKTLIVEKDEIQSLLQNKNFFLYAFKFDE